MRRNPTINPPGEFGRGLVGAMAVSALYIVGMFAFGLAVMKIVITCLWLAVGAMLLFILVYRHRLYQEAKQFELRGRGFFTVTLAETRESVDPKTMREWLPDDWRQLARVLGALRGNMEGTFLVRCGSPYGTRIIRRCSLEDPATLVALEEDVGASGKEELPLGVSYSVVTIDRSGMTAKWEGCSYPAAELEPCPQS